MDDNPVQKKSSQYQQADEKVSNLPDISSNAVIKLIVWMAKVR